MHDFAHGVCFVSLAPISDPELIMPTIAQALGLPEAADEGQGRSQRPLARLQTYLHEKQVLLLLDNFEQVVAAAPALVELLATCTQVKALVTSRAVLRVYGEYECPVSPLALPSPKEPPDARAVAQSPAVALFVQRASASLPDFSLTDQNAAVVAAICAHLDGLPLAIELAVARIKLLSPQTLLARLEHRLQVLTSGAQDLPARQQTLRSTITWSYDLLPEGPQRLFRRLSVFVGGCTLGAVEAVCNEVDHMALDVLDGVASLVDNSLLQQTERAGDEPRFVMLETIREYGLECLAARGELEEARRAHTSYYLRLSEEAEPKLASAEREQWAHRLEKEHDNLRAALSWSIERKEAATALRLGGALLRFWLLQGHLSEGRQWLEKALAEGVSQASHLAGTQVPPAVWAKALGGAGVLTHYQGDYRQAKLLCEESLALFRELSARSPGETAFKQGMVASLNGLGLIACARNGYAEARALHEESLALLRELGDTWGIAEALFFLTRVAFSQGGYTAGKPLCEESLALFRALGDRRGIAHTLGMLGYMAFYEGNYAAELPSMEEGLAIMRELGDRRNVARPLLVLGGAAFVQDDYAKARSFYEEALAIVRESGEKWYIAACLEGLAGVAAAQGQLEWASHLLGAAAVLHEALGVSIPLSNRAYERTVDSTRAQLGEEGFAAAWAEGREMTLKQVLAEQGRATPPTVPTIPQPTGTATLPPTSPDELTPREVEVLRLLAAGLSNAQMAEQLIISPRTVHAHVRSIYSKLGITSRSAATRYAIDHKLL
jgi:predicted ATPase/DNA-binding CsgD family transcriptional regulator